MFEYFLVAIAAIILLYAASLAVHPHSPGVARGLVCLCAAIVCGFAGLFVTGLIVKTVAVAYAGPNREDGFGLFIILTLFLTPLVALGSAIYGAYRTGKWLTARERQRTTMSDNGTRIL